MLQWLSGAVRRVSGNQCLIGDSTVVFLLESLKEVHPLGVEDKFVDLPPRREGGEGPKHPNESLPRQKWLAAVERWIRDG